MWNSMIRASFVFLWLAIPLSGMANTPKETLNAPSPTITRTGGLTRSQAIDYAYKHNPTLLVFRAKIRRALARFKGSKIFPNNPRLTALGGAQLPSASPSASPLLPRVATRLFLPLPVGGRWGKKQRWAKAQLQRVRAEMKLRKYHLSIQIHRAWNKAAVARKRYLLQRNIAAFLKRLANLSRKRLKQGVGNQLEYQLAITSELRATQAEYNASANYRQQRQQLSALLGWPTPATLQIQNDTIPEPPAAPSLSALLRRNLPNHPILLLARAALEQSKTGLLWAQAKGIPDLTVVMGYSLEDGAHIVTGGISIPLPLFWRNQGGIGQQRAKILQSKRMIVSQRFILRQKALRALSHYRNDLKVIGIFRQRLQSAQKQFSLIEKGLKLGVFTPLQTLTAQRSIVGSQLQQLQLISHALSHYVDVCEAVGLSPQWTGRKP